MVLDVYEVGMSKEGYKRKTDGAYIQSKAAAKRHAKS